jgi:hypothetical protein
MLFETNPIELKELLTKIATGQIQLPDFQRPWKWDDERIVSLLATVALGYPLGVVMTLQTGGSGIRFKPRPLDGADVPPGAQPTELLMDGQQRLTSLFQALRSGKPVDTMDTRGKKLLRWYYLDIERSLDPATDGEDAIVWVPENRKRPETSDRGPVDVSTLEAECTAGLFPLRLVFQDELRGAWHRAYVQTDNSRWGLWTKFQASSLWNIQSYKVPVIRLTQDTPKEAVCTVFEQVNTKGVQLTVFELLTATYAADPDYFHAHRTDFHLPEDWQRIKAELSSHAMFADLQDTDFLQAVCLVSTYHQRRGRPGADPFDQPSASVKRKDILALPLTEYLTWAPRIVDALHWSAHFLNRQGIFGSGDLPYRSQLPPLAAIRTVLGDQADTAEAERKITRWYWCGVLGEQYGGSLDSRLPRDLEQVVAWVRGGREPTSVALASFPAARLNTMSTRNSAAYKGLYALLMKQGCTDWTYTKEPIDANIFADQQVDLALIFPKQWCDKNGIPHERRDSIVNKTPLTNRTRRIIANLAPNVYMVKLEAEAGLPGNWLDDIIGTHLIDARYLRGSNGQGGPLRVVHKPAALGAADFDAFYESRSARLLELIEDAMGRRAVPQEAAPESAADYQQEQPA